MENEKQKLFEKGLDILLVEDDNFLASILTKTLNNDGAKVVHAESGKSAIDNLETFTPQVILLDLMLPGEIDGFGVLQKIRDSEKTKNAIVIILSNMQEEPQITRAKALHADAYMIKATVTPDAVAKKIKTILDTKK